MKLSLSNHVNTLYCDLTPDEVHMLCLVLLYMRDHPDDMIRLHVQAFTLSNRAP